MIKKPLFLIAWDDEEGGFGYAFDEKELKRLTTGKTNFEVYRHVE